MTDKEHCFPSDEGVCVICGFPLLKNYFDPKTLKWKRRPKDCICEECVNRYPVKQNQETNKLHSDREVEKLEQE